jgi:hypothetical protein
MLDLISIVVLVGSFVLFNQAQRRNMTWLWVVTVGTFAAITLWSLYGLVQSLSPMAAISVLVCGYVTKLAFDRSGLRYRLKRYFRRGGRR